MASGFFLTRRFLPGPLATTWLRQLGFILLLNVAITFGIPHISASAHFGGGIAGLVIAVPLEYVRYGRGWQRLASALGLIAMPLVFLGIVVYSIDDKDRLKAILLQAEQVADNPEGKKIPQTHAHSL